MTAVQTANAIARLPHERARGLALTVRRRNAAQALRTLRIRLPRAAVRELMQALREHVGITQMMRTWPTPRQQHSIGAQIAAHAQGLRDCLLALPPTTGQKLWIAVADALGDTPPSRSDTARILQVLEFVCRSRAAQINPPQARRRSHVNIVASVHRFAPDVAVSASAGSIFHTLVGAAFVLAGVTVDPAGAIRAYLNLPGIATGQ